MAVWSQATLSGITVFDRCDGEYFLPAYIKNEKKLTQVETTSLPQMFFVSDGNHLSVSRHFSDDGDIPYFRGQDINDFFLENASPIMIPEKVFLSPMMARSHFFAGDVLLSIVGTIGSLSIVPESLGSATGSCKIAILRSKGVYSPFVLAAFLLSRFGQLQIRRNTRGAVQMGLILKDLARIHVPVFEEAVASQIEHFVKQSIEANTQSKTAYTQAQQLLESELGLDKLRFDKPVGYTARFSVVGLFDSVSGNRIDAQCFSPEAVFYEDWLLKHANCDRLNLLLSSTAKGRQQVEAETGTTDYCSIKHITGREIVGASKAYPAAGTPTARKDDLLLAITGATIGKIGIINRYDNLVFSGDMLRLRANGSVNPHYLLLTLDHHLGQVQFNRWITGSTNGHLASRDVGRVLVPRFAPEKEEQIAALVAESLEKRQESEQLLDQAKTRVEQLIEEAVRA
jgi:hypothetical protein